MILAFDIGGTFIKWGLVSNYEIIKNGKINTPIDSFENLLNSIEEIVNEHRDTEITGLAFSLPGTIDKETGIIKQGGSLRYNDKRNFKKEVEEYFKMPVTLENDARCAAIAEVNLGNLKNIENGIVIVVGTGIGGSLIKGGQVHYGSHGYSGEFSMLMVRDFNKYGMDALFGNVTGMRSFIQKVKSSFNDETITGEKFFDMVKKKDVKAEELFDDYTNTFAQELFNLQMMFDPERIVIGGGISEESIYVNSIQTKFEKIFNSFPIEIRHADVMACKYTNMSNILGATIVFYENNN